MGRLKITSMGKERSRALAELIVASVSMQYYSSSYERIRRKPYGEVQVVLWRSHVIFGDDLGFWDGLSK